MPILKNAKKALRQDRRRTVVNRRVKDAMRSAIKIFHAGPSKDLLSSAYQKIDRAVKKNLIPKNRAARMKSQLSRFLKTQAVKPAKKSPAKKSASKKTAKKA